MLLKNRWLGRLLCSGTFWSQVRSIILSHEWPIDCFLCTVEKLLAYHLLYWLAKENQKYGLRRCLIAILSLPSLVMLLLWNTVPLSGLCHCICLLLFFLIYHMIQNGAIYKIVAYATQFIIRCNTERRIWMAREVSVPINLIPGV